MFNKIQLAVIEELAITEIEEINNFFTGSEASKKEYIDELQDIANIAMYNSVPRDVCYVKVTNLALENRNVREYGPFYGWDNAADFAEHWQSPTIKCDIYILFHPEDALRGLI